MKTIALTLSGILGTSLLFGQYTNFVTSGTIEFEKSVNMYAVIPRSFSRSDEVYMKQFLDQYKKDGTQFLLFKSTLNFSGQKTFFIPVKDDNRPAAFVNHPIITQNNIIFTDLTAGVSTCRKTVFEETLLVTDSIRKIQWKITGETRDIAGYSCRRANAIIMDSIYVVAFYTGEIPIPGGPESFSGLPGMILGIALPHENISWFATKVTPQAIQQSSLKQPSRDKAKVTDTKGLQSMLTASLKNWGTFANSYFKAFFL